MDSSWELCGEYCQYCGYRIGFPGIQDVAVKCAGCNRLYGVTWDGQAERYVLIIESIWILVVKRNRRLAQGGIG